MICLICKANNAKAAQFCTGCGVELRKHNPPPSQSPSQEEEITRLQSDRAPAVTIVDRESDPFLGSILARKYRIEAKLGAGGMGAVYRATRVELGDEVAVKILHAEQNDPKAAARFRREAQAAARLKHPNAVTIHDFGITDAGLQYLVMDLVEGKSLRQIIKQEGPITPSASAEIITQVCAALDEAHRHHIIHRDVKPDNIIVNTTNTGLHVKVLDFGIAKLRDDTANTLTQTGSILGTPHYMSPEQCLGEELDARSDIYSVGIVLYEMLTGLVPFNSPSSSAVVVQHVTQAPPSLRSHNVSLSPAIETVVLRALEKQRSARPQTASELASDFKAATTQPNVPPPAPSIPHTNSTQPGQSNTPSSGAPTTVMPNQPSGQRLTDPTWGRGSATPSSRTQNPSSITLIVMGAIILVGLGGAIGWALLKDGEATNKPASPSRVQITATASSVLPPASGTNYEPGNTLDAQLNTAWVEGVEGTGIGQWIRFDFDREIDLRGLTIAPGYFKTPVIWSINNRLAAVAIQFSDGSTQHVRFSDRMEQQHLPLGSIRTSWVRIVIEEVYFSRDQKDTALSEVLFDFGNGISTIPAPSVESSQPAGSNYDSTEARIVSGQMIGSSDLRRFDKAALQRLRNAVYARHGRIFDREDLRQYFSSKPWYTPRPDYLDTDLTLSDKANVNLILAAEKGAP